jgi:hypothetical protein
MDARVIKGTYTDDDFQAFGALERFVFIWLFTNSEVAASSCGYQVISKAAFSFETLQPLATLSKVLQALPRSIVWDEQDGKIRVLMLNYIKHQYNFNTLNRKSIVFTSILHRAARMPEHFRKALSDRYPSLGIEIDAYLASLGLAKANRPLEALSCDKYCTDQHNTVHSPCTLDPEGRVRGEAEWPTREEWMKASEMEGVPEGWAEREWHRQEAMPPAERWKKTDRKRLRHHAAFVMSNGRMWGWPVVNGAHGSDGEVPKTKEL